MFSDCDACLLWVVAIDLRVCVRFYCLLCVWFIRWLCLIVYFVLFG